MTADKLLDFLPQQEPFRFVDRVLEVDRTHIVCSYTFRPDAPFYAGHFPGKPLTPGVIVLEAMAQAGVALHCIYLTAIDGGQVQDYHALFTDAKVEWHRRVMPGEKLVTRGELIAWRRMRIRSRVAMYGKDGGPVVSGVLGGMGVKL